VLNAAYERAFVSQEAGLRRQTRGQSVPLALLSQSIHREWYRSSKRALTRLEQLAETGRLESPPGLGDDARKSRHAIAASLLHMTNNRLGITIAEEAYLAYLLRRAIETNLTRVAVPCDIPFGAPA
jgi:hypothetical protein